MLTHPSGNLMVVEAMAGLDIGAVDRLVVVVINDHVQNAGLRLDILESSFYEMKGLAPTFVELDHFTDSQSETVYKAIKKAKIEGSVFIKDCDNYFETEISPTNNICYAELARGINAVNKSYVTFNKFGQVTGIVEKSVVGNQFCVGGYGFESAEQFASTYERISGSNNPNEIYISHVIQQMLVDGVVFHGNTVSNYLDWGTLEDWKRYTNEFRTLFVDLDGVVVENASECFEPGFDVAEPLQKNIDLLNRLYDAGKTTIVLTTARKENLRDVTNEQLERIGLRHHALLMGLPHAKRVLINDYAGSNPYPTAIAINLRRNSDNLEDYLCELGI